jgi:hypothetical protein
VAGTDEGYVSCRDTAIEVQSCGYDSTSHDVTETPDEAPDSTVRKADASRNPVGQNADGSQRACPARTIAMQPDEDSALIAGLALAEVLAERTAWLRRTQKPVPPDDDDDDDDVPGPLEIRPSRRIAMPNQRQPLGHATRLQVFAGAGSIWKARAPEPTIGIGLKRLQDASPWAFSVDLVFTGRSRSATLGQFTALTWGIATNASYRLWSNRHWRFETHFGPRVFVHLTRGEAGLREGVTLNERTAWLWNVAPETAFALTMKASEATTFALRLSCALPLRQLELTEADPDVLDEDMVILYTASLIFGFALGVEF